MIITLFSFTNKNIFHASSIISSESLYQSSFWCVLIARLTHYLTIFTRVLFRFWIVGIINCTFFVLCIRLGKFFTFNSIHQKKMSIESSVSGHLFSEIWDGHMLKRLQISRDLYATNAAIVTLSEKINKHHKSIL